MTTSRARAFTLVEILVAMGIFAILAAATAPAFYSFMRSRQTTGVIGDLVETLRYAQQDAVYNREPRTVVIDIEKGSYWVLAPPDPDERRRKRRNRRRSWDDDMMRVHNNKLPDGFRFGAVHYVQEQRDALEGETAIHFFPDGSATGVNVLVQRLPDSRDQRVVERAVFVNRNSGRVGEMSYEDRIERFGMTPS